MSYLLDTNVLSELARSKKNAGVLDWLAATRGSEHYISVLTMGELLRGVTKLRHHGEQNRAAAIEQFVLETERRFASRILGIGHDVVRVWAAQSPMQPLPVVDGLIAATAAVHGWTVVTRNVEDFERSGVPVLNPFTP